MKKLTHAERGRKGGASRSRKKLRAIKANSKKGGEALKRKMLRVGSTANYRGKRVRVVGLRPVMVRLIGQGYIYAYIYTPKFSELSKIRNSARFDTAKAI